LSEGECIEVGVQIAKMRDVLGRWRMGGRWCTMHFVRDVTYVAGYKLLLTFEDGSMRLVDLERELDGEMFEPLRRQLLRDRSPEPRSGHDRVG